MVKKIEVQGNEISISNVGNGGYISLTDIARYRNNSASPLP